MQIASVLLGKCLLPLRARVNKSQGMLSICLEIRSRTNDEIKFHAPVFCRDRNFMAFESLRPKKFDLDERRKATQLNMNGRLMIYSCLQ